MQVDDDTWARLREAYETASEPLKAIAAREGISVQRLVARARADGWSARPKAKARPGTPAVQTHGPAGLKVKKKKHTGLPTHGTQRALIGRLFRAISLKLEHMEKRMASGEARSAQDEERESRALATLINNFEKVTEAVAELDKERDAPRSARGANADAERMRREIAERLERLGGIGPAGGGSGGSRS
jgi:hypothetical protein